jgi:hypothetical protein
MGKSRNSTLTVTDIENCTSSAYSGALSSSFSSSHSGTLVIRRMWFGGDGCLYQSGRKSDGLNTSIADAGPWRGVGYLSGYRATNSVTSMSRVRDMAMGAVDRAFAYAGMESTNARLTISDCSNITGAFSNALFRASGASMTLLNVSHVRKKGFHRMLDSSTGSSLVVRQLSDVHDRHAFYAAGNLATSLVVDIDGANDVSGASFIGYGAVNATLRMRNLRNVSAGGFSWHRGVRRRRCRRRDQRLL